MLSLALIAADGGDTATVGTGSAETALSAVDLEVSDPDHLLDLVEGLDGELSLGVLDAATLEVASSPVSRSATPRRSTT